MNENVRPALESGNREYFHDEFDDGSALAVSLERYFDIVRNNKLLIVGILAIALALGLAAALLSTPQYRSTARVEISLAEQNVTNVEGLQDEAVLADRAYLPTQYELLESHSLATRVIRELDLRDDEAFLEAFEVVPDETLDLDEAIVAILFSNVEISPITGSTLVDISFSSPNPTLSSRLANAWVDAYIEEDLNRRFGATIEARDFLEGRLQQTRERLEDAERDLIAYATDQGLLSLNPDGDQADSSGAAPQTLVATELAAFQRALLDASTQRIAAEAALSARRSGTAQTGLSDTDSTLVGLRQRRNELQIELAELASRFQDGYPPLQVLRAQIAEIDEAIADEERNSVARLQANVSEARGREAQLRRQVAELQGELVSQRRDSVQYNILQREVDTNRELYAGLLQRFREIGLSALVKATYSSSIRRVRLGHPIRLASQRTL